MLTTSAKPTITHLRTNVENALRHYLSTSAISLRKPPKGIHSTANRFKEALDYAVLGGGKRLRPILLLLVGQWFGTPTNRLLPTACALELIHTYSLIHDDLPCMDNATLRRGRPTLHCAYDETTAVLVGDALQPLATQWIFQHTTLETFSDKEALLHVLNEIASASGLAGLIIGQAIDCKGFEKPSNATDLEDSLLWIHTHKTGALFGAALACGGWLSGRDTKTVDTLRQVGHHWGVAFQLADDVLDATASEAECGKTTGQDAANAKRTLIGRGHTSEQVQAKALGWIQKGLDALAELQATQSSQASTARQQTQDDAYDTLCALAWTLVHRST